MRFGLRIALAIVLCAFTFRLPASAQVIASESFDGVTSPTAPPVTGSSIDLTSPVWQRAFRASSFENFTTRKAASTEAEAYLVFGPDAVYCAFLVRQPTESITAKQTSNNVGLGLDDYVSLMFDTSGNGTNQYFFETTPGGIRYQQATESTRFNPSWTAFGRIEGDRWFAEIVVPYRFLRGASRVWRVNFARYVAETQHLYTWAYDGQMNNPYTETFWPKGPQRTLDCGPRAEAHRGDLWIDVSRP